MPRKVKQADNRGGPRQGVQGRAYAQRSDLNNGQRTQPAHVVEAAATAPLVAPTGTPAALPPMPDLRGPTAYPNRPVQHGLSTGPGAGPEVTGLGMDPNRDRLKRLLPVWELMASQPGSSQALRQFVRQVRGGA